MGKKAFQVEVLLIGELRDGEFSAGNLLVKVPG
jgi:hypothetical protein